MIEASGLGRSIVKVAKAPIGLHSKIKQLKNCVTFKLALIN